MARKEKKYIELDQLGSVNNPILKEITRHGHFPPVNKPIGWDDEGFRKIFPTKDLPFQNVEEIKYSQQSKGDNRLIWGDNLAILRSLADESIDLIYIDPPFFSGRNYNLIFGDDDEKRTFRDIWDGGLQTYLAWLNARIFEMKRLLTKTGSLFIHLDWHASHYVKCELDKIFGYENFVNEIVWCYKSGGASKSNFSKKHDIILFYSKTKKFFFKPIKEKSYMGADYSTGNKNVTLYDDNDNLGKYTLVFPKDWWEIGMLATSSKERIGYPTQKPEQLLEKIIASSCPENGIVADFFAGGGTTLATAQKLGRKWVGCDISRIAVQVTSDRLAKINSLTGIKVNDEKVAFAHHHLIQYHGTYIKSNLKQLPEIEFRHFIIKCYEADHYSKGSYIHATKGNYAIFIGPPNAEITHSHVMSFYAEMKEKGFRYGQIVGWKFSAKAEEEKERIISSTRKSEIRDIQAITIKMIDIDSDEFKGTNIRFVNKPMCNIRNKAKSKDGLEWEFDASNSAPQTDAKILHIQWDFNYTGHFKPGLDWNFDNDSENNTTMKIVKHRFDKKGEHRVALRILDSKGGVAIHDIKVVA